MNWLKQLNAYLQKLRLKYIFILYITLYKDYIARHEIHFDPQSMIDATLRITLTWNSLLSRANFADMLFEDKFWIIFNNCDNWCRHYVVEITFIIANNKKKKKKKRFFKVSKRYNAYYAYYDCLRCCGASLRKLLCSSWRISRRFLEGRLSFFYETFLFSIFYGIVLSLFKIDPSVEAISISLNFCKCKNKY